MIKPAVSAGSKDTGRYGAADPEHRALAAEHVARLQAAGRLVMVQPYLPAVDTAGETALLFLGGAYSHAIRKGPMLDGPDRRRGRAVQGGVDRPADAVPAELAVAAQALAAVPGGACSTPGSTSSRARTARRDWWSWS